MDDARVTQVLDECEARLEAGEPVDLRGFWEVVAAAKRDPELARRHASRLRRIDLEAFQRAAFLTIPLPVGTVVMLAGTATGLAALVAAGRRGDGGGLLLAGTGILLGTTHSLAHLAVGTLQGMRFAGWFVWSPLRPQPGVKTDLPTYLAVPARERAWMHASGALVTKAVPFLGLLVGGRSGAPRWARRLLVLLGFAQIVTDAVWSVRASDWRKFRREMRVAREG